METDTGTQVKFDSITIKVPTPDGTMFVTVLESPDGKPVGLQITIGKAGIAVSAWANALSRMISAGFDRGISINDVIHELSSITTSGKMVMKDGGVIRSGPEGVCVALMKYRSEKYRTLVNTLGGDRSDGDGRGARLDDRRTGT